MDAIGYVRVSTDAQAAEDRFGIDAQKATIQTYADQHDISIIKWIIDEGISGVQDERSDEFNNIVYGDISNPPYQAVLVAKSDRIARDINLYFYFKMLLLKKDIKIISVAEDFGMLGAFSSMLETFTMFVAEQERNNITRRTSSGRAVKSEQGGYAGGKAPYGYSSQRGSGKLVINPAEVPLIQRIFGLRDEGCTIKGIVETLRAEGFRTRKGGDFQLSTVQYILTNRKTYEGYYKYGKNGEWVKGQHEAILQGSGKAAE